MSAVLSDLDIERLLEEPKTLAADWEQKLALKQKRGHREAHLDLMGQDGSEFKLILRQSDENVFDFSAIFGYCQKESWQLIRLMFRQNILECAKGWDEARGLREFCDALSEHQQNMTDDGRKKLLGHVPSSGV